MKYSASFAANNSTLGLNILEGANLQRMIRDIRDIAEGNRSEHNSCTWTVRTEDNGVLVAAGGMSANGRRYRLM